MRRRCRLAIAAWVGCAGVVPRKKMKRFHIAISVADIARSIKAYTDRLGAGPTVIVPGEYALWRTESLNLSIRRTDDAPGTLRHLGWEDPAAEEFASDEDENGIAWERFNQAAQEREILDRWPHALFVPPSVSKE